MGSGFWAVVRQPMRKQRRGSAEVFGIGVCLRVYAASHELAQQSIGKASEVTAQASGSVGAPRRAVEDVGGAGLAGAFEVVRHLVLVELGVEG